MIPGALFSAVHKDTHVYFSWSEVQNQSKLIIIMDLEYRDDHLWHLPEQWLVWDCRIDSEKDVMEIKREKKKENLRKETKNLNQAGK